MADGRNDEVTELQEAILEFRKEEANADLVLVAAQKCMNSGNASFVADILLQQECKDVLEFVGWELIRVVSHSVLEASDEMADRLSNKKRILAAVGKTCSPKEVCLGVLEQLDSSLSPEKGLILLQPLQKALERMDHKKSKFLRMACPQVSGFLKNIPVTDEGKDSQESHTDSLEMQTALSEVLQFLNPFVEEIYDLRLPMYSESILPPEGYREQQESLISCLISLLHYPLVFTSVVQDCELDVEDSDVSEESSSVPKTQLCCYRGFAEQILRYLHRCSCSFVYLVEYSWRNAKRYSSRPSRTLNIEEQDDIGKKQDCEHFDILGLGCFAYLVLVEDIQNDHFPAVFSQTYLLNINMKHISSLLQRRESQVVYKGLELLNSLCGCLKERSIEQSYLEGPEFLDTAKALVNIMVLSPSKKLRQKAVRALPQMISKMDSRGRYKLLHFLLQDESAHPGVAGLLIHALKENINESLKADEKDRWFTGSRLMSLLQHVLKLPSGVDKGEDIVRETDRIMATLNCLRFVLLRDLEDETCVWADIADVQKSYLAPLGDTLRATRIQYHAELGRKQEESKGTAPMKKAEGDVEFSVTTLEGNPLHCMPLEEQREALQSGLYSLDMMESVLVRLSEIIDSRTQLGTHSHSRMARDPDGEKGC